MQTGVALAALEKNRIHTMVGPRIHLPKVWSREGVDVTDVERNERKKKFHSGEQIMKHYIKGYRPSCPHCGEDHTEPPKRWPWRGAQYDY